MVEYILLVALIALAVIGAVVFLSQQTDSKFQDAGNQIKAAGSGQGCNPGDTASSSFVTDGGVTIVTCTTPLGGHYQVRG
jgi:Flp pilus assembly pilin Flp